MAGQTTSDRKPSTTVWQEMAAQRACWWVELREGVEGPSAVSRGSVLFADGHDKTEAGVRRAIGASRFVWCIASWDGMRLATSRERNEVKLPHTRGFIRDIAIAGGFIAIGILAPGWPNQTACEAHLGGISVGLGLGWLIKCFIDLQGSSHAKQS